MKVKMYPMCEMAGPKHFRMLYDILYIYNIMANNNLNIILLIPFLSTFMITLNIYNGDLNKIISWKKLKKV